MLAAALAVVFCCAGVSAAAVATETPKAEFYEKQVRPLLESHCLKCHGGEERIKGGLNLTSRNLLARGGDLGPAIDEKEPAKSLLLKAISYKDEDLQMPPKGKLPQEAIDVLTRWIEMGAPYSGGEKTAAATAQQAPPPADSPEARAFWSFKPVVRPAAPQVKDRAWVRNPIDAFILAKLEAKGFAPAKLADRVALLRRAYYDLIGLPPTPAEIDAFLADASPDAYERVIDRLLASGHYGEKWGRHWLDLVRFAETNSYERDNPKPHAWRYRDYVIRSFNADKPYDLFVREQIAGDEMPDAETNPDRVVATGFYRMGIWDDEPTDKEQARYDGLDDIVATVGQVMLGLTVDCARCHDHKIDPLPQADYYKLVAFFENINHYRNGGPTDERPIFSDAAGREAYELRQQERVKRRDDVTSLVKEMERDFRQLISGEPGRESITLADVPELILKEGRRVLGAERFARYRQLKREVEDLKKPVPGFDLALAVTERGPTPPETHILIRGNPAAKGKVVHPGFMTVLGSNASPVSEPAALPRSSGRRTVLANWLASASNPLFARVMVNRIWQYHFGRGIVRSSSNFGLQGDRPTHPELLDWLSAEFADRGWSLKQMHRLIMTSSAYRMASLGDEKVLAADPQNDLFWRYDLRRLSAEEIRDSILYANRTLNLKQYGPSVYPLIPREVMMGQSKPGQGWNTSGPDEAARRSVYVHVKRSLRVPILEAFDAAETDKSCPVRFVTVQPTQALGMLNSEFMQQEAQKLADRLRREAGEGTGSRVAMALRLLTCRTPSDREIARGVDLIDKLTSEEGVSPDTALRYFCLMALNLNEFVYLD